ncbi:hypothetical protein [Algoriphagus boritolerans]|uniref:hypothetical protein n=1 Tax=Algoriphagus boritolerans TaxID=308111 RepID=UPI002FCDFA00
MMSKRLCLVFIFFISLFQHAHPQLITDNELPSSIEEDVNLNSPYHTTLTFFYNLDRNHFFPERAAKTLDLKNTEGDPEELAIKLQQIFEGKGIVIRTSEIPNDANFTDSTANGEQRFYFDKVKLPAIFLDKVGNQWKFSSFSVARLPTSIARPTPMAQIDFSISCQK